MEMEKLWYKTPEIWHKIDPMQGRLKVGTTFETHAGAKAIKSRPILTRYLGFKHPTFDIGRNSPTI
jgi:hypothetical protein